MNEFQIALLVGATIVAILSWRLDRSLLWIGMGALSFVASTAYARYQLPMPSLFTACCDAAVCLTIVKYGRQAWELILYRVFQSSVLISIVFLGFTIFAKSGSSPAYVALLEAVNWIALLLIMGTAAMQRVKANGGASFYLGRRVVLRTQHALFSPKRAHTGWNA